MMIQSRLTAISDLDLLLSFASEFSCHHLFIRLKDWIILAWLLGFARKLTLPLPLIKYWVLLSAEK
jgi:hypothetical protein